VTVPLDAARSGEWTEDSWALATNVFSACYIGGWSACEYWGFTDQVFRDLLVFTTRRVRKRLEYSVVVVHSVMIRDQIVTCQ